MQRGSRRSFARRAFFGVSQAVTSKRSPPPDLRVIRDAKVAAARERVFGPQGNMPGDRHFRKRLEGDDLMRWYFPSKYAMPDFRVDDYFEMQAERLAPRPTHPCAEALSDCLRKVSLHRKDLKQFFAKLDQATFLASPTLQDLYGLFRLVDADKALDFDIPERVFRHHSPLFGGKEAPIQVEPFTSQADLHLQIQRQLRKQHDSTTVANVLRTELIRQQSVENVKQLLLEAKDKHNVVPDFTHVVVAPEPTVRAVYAHADHASDHEQAKASSASDSQFVDSFGTEVRSLRAYGVRRLQPNVAERKKVQKEAEIELEKLRKAGHTHKYLKLRHRFVDPMFRRRRLKWMERQVAGRNKPAEVKFNSYYAPHPDDHVEFPTNKGSVTVVWPSPYH